MGFSASTKYLLNRNFLSIIAILLIAVVSITNFRNKGLWRQSDKIIAWDVISYYAYLPAAFIYNDLALDFIDDDPEYFSDKIWPELTEDGSRVIKTTMGLSYMYLPAFFAGHVAASISDHDANGYSAPYRYSLQLGGILIMLISFFIIRKILLRYFNDITTAVTILLLAFATNIYYYGTIESSYPHIYSFFLISLFLALTIRYYERQGHVNIILIGLLLGLITLVRPTNIIIVLVFLLWEIDSYKKFSARIKLLTGNLLHPGLFITCFFIPWIPQMIYWNEITGSLFYFSYTGERFFFGNPHIIDGLFSFRKGLILYTPIVILMWFGIYFMNKKLKTTRPAIILFTIINSYIIFSWWCWWYGGCYGQRPFIDSFALYALPLAALIDRFFNLKTVGKLISGIILFMLLVHGIYQTTQYYFGAIHWDSMTRESYFDSFGRLKPSVNFYNLLKEPDYEKASNK